MTRPRISTDSMDIPTGLWRIAENQLYWMVTLPRANRRDSAALAAVSLAIFIALVVPHWTTTYAAGLIVFTIWMGWFVEVFARFLGSDRRI